MPGLWELFRLLAGEVLLYLALGALLARLTLFPEAVVQFVLRNFVVRTLLPLLVLQKVSAGLRANDLAGVAAMFAGALAMVFLTALAARALARPHSPSTFTLAGTFHNYGFIVYPLVWALYGDRALSLAFVFALPCDGLFWSFGVGLLRVDRSGWSGSLRAMLNPPFVAVLLSVALALSGAARALELGERLAPLESVTRFAIPTALTCVGGVFFHSVRGIRGELTQWRELPWGDLGRLMALRTLVVPLAMGVGVVSLVEPPALRSVLVVQAVMPASIGMVVLPTLFGGDRLLITWFSALSNSLGFVTIPLYLRLLA